MPPVAERTIPKRSRNFSRSMSQTRRRSTRANFLADVIDNDRVGKTVFEMKWSRIDLSKSTHQLLTSDRPINMPLGLADPEAYISLPVSPRILFVLPRPESTCNDCATIAENFTDL